MVSFRKGVLVTIIPLKCSGIVKSVGRSRNYMVAVTYWSRSEGAPRTEVFPDCDLELVGSPKRRAASACQ